MVATLTLAGVVGAQGDDGDTRELFHETSRPFEVMLRVEPAEVVSGVVHFVVTVLAVGDSEPVDAAVINIVATDADGSAVQSRAHAVRPYVTA